MVQKSSGLVLIQRERSDEKRIRPFFRDYQRLALVLEGVARAVAIRETEVPLNHKGLPFKAPIPRLPVGSPKSDRTP